jgi:hypothetical protein
MSEDTGMNLGVQLKWNLRLSQLSVKAFGVLFSGNAVRMLACLLLLNRKGHFLET